MFKRTLILIRDREGGGGGGEAQIFCEDTLLKDNTQDLFVLQLAEKFAAECKR